MERRRRIGGEQVAHKRDVDFYSIRVAVRSGDLDFVRIKVGDMRWKVILDPDKRTASLKADAMVV